MKMFSRCSLLLLVPMLAGAQDFGLSPRAVPQAAATAEANAALDAHEYEKALKLLAPLAAASPKDAHIAYDMGGAHDALDHTSAAEASYRTAVADDAGYIDPHVSLGLLMARNGRFAEARTELLAATEIQAGDPLLKARAYRALARLDQRERPAEARDELLQALKLSPETSDDTLLGAELAAGASHGEGAAEAAYRKVLLSQPGDPAATAELAHLLIVEKRAGDAEPLLTSALTTHPGDPTLTSQLAALYTSQGRVGEAVPLVEAVYKANPRDANIGHLLAGLYLQSKDYARAEPLLGTLSAQNPKDASLVEEHARALIHLLRFAEAEQILERIVAQPSLFAGPLDLADAAGDLAFAASSNNEPAVALHALEVRATVLPPSAPALFLLAISHDKLRQTKPAIEAYKQFLEASKGSHPDEEFEARHRLIALEHLK